MRDRQVTKRTGFTYLVSVYMGLPGVRLVLRRCVFDTRDTRDTRKGEALWADLRVLRVLRVLITDLLRMSEGPPMTFVWRSSVLHGPAGFA